MALRDAGQAGSSHVVVQAQSDARAIRQLSSARGVLRQVPIEGAGDGAAPS
eukprot:COSAG06_NODE_42899_length_377_cov_0.888489_1_plen_50_part_01